MKKLIFSAMTIGLLSFVSPLEAKEVRSNESEPVKTEKNVVTAKSLEARKVEAMIKRIEEIKAMDLGSLALEERKALKKELRGIKQEMKAVEGVFVSYGALIVILILLLLLL